MLKLLGTKASLILTIILRAIRINLHRGLGRHRVVNFLVGLIMPLA